MGGLQGMTRAVRDIFSCRVQPTILLARLSEDMKTSVLDAG